MSKKITKYEEFCSKVDYHFAEIQKTIRDLKASGKGSKAIVSECIEECIVLNHEIEQKLEEFLV